MTGDLWRTCLCSKFDLNGVLWADFLHGRAEYVTKWVRLSRICVTVTRNRFSSHPAWPVRNLRSKWYSTILNFGEGSSQNRTSRYSTWPQTGHIRLNPSAKISNMKVHFCPFPSATVSYLLVYCPGSLSSSVIDLSSVINSLRKEQGRPKNVSHSMGTRGCCHFPNCALSSLITQTHSPRSSHLLLEDSSLNFRE